MTNSLSEPLIARVLQNGTRALPGNPPMLNRTVEVPPGSYIVEVNRTQRPVTIELGRKTIGPAS